MLTVLKHHNEELNGPTLKFLITGSKSMTFLCGVINSTSAKYCSVAFFVWSNYSKSSSDSNHLVYLDKHFSGTPLYRLLFNTNTCI